MSDEESARRALKMPPATAYGIRAYYTSILSTTHGVRQDLLARVDVAKSEVERLSGLVRRSDDSIEALEQVLATVDDWIRGLNIGDQGAEETIAQSGGRSRAARRNTQAEERKREETSGEESAERS